MVADRGRKRQRLKLLRGKERLELLAVCGGIDLIACRDDKICAGIDRGRKIKRVLPISRVGRNVFRSADLSIADENEIKALLGSFGPEIEIFASFKFVFVSSCCVCFVFSVLDSSSQINVSAKRAANAKR